MTANWREYLYELSPTWLRRHWGERFVGAHGLLADYVSEGIALALRNGHVNDPELAADALALIASERGLPKYEVETAANHLARVQNAWTVWQDAGEQPNLELQFEYAGFAGTQVLTHADATFGDPANWSEFIISIPEGSHSVTGTGPKWGNFIWGSGTLYGATAPNLWGGFNWGDGALWGPTGLTVPVANSIRAILRKWKPVDWICPYIVFQINGWAWGDGHTWGQASLKWGGDSSRFTP